MIHSGSRNLGYKVAEHYNKLAVELNKKYYSQVPTEWDLAFLPINSPDGQAYIREMNYCVEFAKANRKLMMDNIIKVFENQFESFEELNRFDVAHNYCAQENHFGSNVFVHRKGATRARQGEICIVPGCFAKKTRILLSSGLYKNIEDLEIGEKIINGKGEITTVKNIFNKGVKKVVKYKNNTFYKYTYATLDHKHFICDFSSIKNRQDISMKKVADKKNNNGESKYKWKELKYLTKKNSTLLIPKKINFDIKESFELTLLNKKIKPTYEIGYLFGTFLGDGCSFYNIKKGGSVAWYFGRDEKIIADKLINILENLNLKASIIKTNIIFIRTSSSELSLFFKKFKKNNEKYLPEFLWCKNEDYLRGVYDGLIDSDGHKNNGTKKLTNTSSLLIEQFGTIHYLLLGYYPSVSVRKPSCGNLKNCDIKNVKKSFRSTSLLKPMISNEYQLIPIYEIYHDEIIEVETYDIETSDSEHSFIANNSIVHNSQGSNSFITIGLGNKDSFHSSSHGAGRLMSRSKAQKELSIENEQKILNDMGVVHAIRGKHDLDEAPSAYKNIEDVMENQKDLVDILVTLTPLGVIKA